MYNEYVVEEYERNGHTVKILVDVEPESPRDWDNVGTMIVKHPRYNLGDRPFDSDEEAAMHRGFDVFSRYMRLVHKAKVVLPLSIYDHSGLSMWVGTPYTDSYRSWDSSFVGAIVAFTEDIVKEGISADNVEEILRSEVDVYDQYLRGDIYGFDIQKDDEETVESCFGFYGLDEVKQEANAIADSL